MHTTLTNTRRKFRAEIPSSFWETAVFMLVRFSSCTLYTWKNENYLVYGSVKVWVGEVLCQKPRVIAASKKHVVVTMNEVDVMSEVCTCLSTVDAQRYLHVGHHAIVQFPREIILTCNTKVWSLIHRRRHALECCGHSKFNDASTRPVTYGIWRKSPEPPSPGTEPLGFEFGGGCVWGFISKVSSWSMAI